MDGVQPVELLQVLYFFAPAYLANMAPVLARGHFEMLAAPIDGGHRWRGRRILGDHKTWRGIVAGVVAGMLVFAVQCWMHRVGYARGLALLDYGSVDVLLPGALLGLGAGVGDAVKSFFKRRIDIAPGASWLGFDQLDFMVGAYALVSLVVVPPPLATLAILPIVFLGSLAATASGYWLGLKEAWV
jgi:CDP-2,3-bis-(O-geranylgeranyl)-sn-glycerol synthase